MVSVIIVNFNGESYLKNCLDSVFKINYENYEIIIVDDGSTDESISIIKKFQTHHRNLYLYKNRKNIGASSSRNKAIKKAEGELIVFLDNDTVVTSDWLTELVKPLLKDKALGGAQSLIMDLDKKDLIQNAGGKLMKQTCWLLPNFQWEKISKKIKGEFIIGISASLVIRKSILKNINGFDEMEAVTTEDIDLCWRVWISGRKIVLAKNSIMYHKTKQMSDRESMKSTYRKTYFHLAKNSFRSIIKNFEIKNIVIYLPQSVIVNLGRAVYFLLQGRTDALLGFIDATFWNIFNLENTLLERKKTQKTRKFSDEYLFKSIFSHKNIFDSVQTLMK